MLKNVIEDYLISIKEIQFLAPFQALLEKMDYYDINLIHGSYEFGKDFIAKKNENGIVTQYCFQLKVGNVNLSRFTNEIKHQLLEIITNKISHPNYDPSLKQKIVFVTTGIIQPPATISFQEFNAFVHDKFGMNPILTWDKNKILSDFIRIGIEPFFELHNTPEFVIRFFELYSKIKKQHELNSFDVVNYTDYWLALDLSIQENKLQVLFEGYFFSKILFDNRDYYNSVLFLSAVGRALHKYELFAEYKSYLISSILEIIDNYHIEYLSNIKSNRINYFMSKGLFSIFTYPTVCLKSLELFSIYLLLSEENNELLMKSFFNLLEEKGSYRPISNNYGSAIFLTSLVLFKLKKYDILKKYINNITVWICDRYKQNGLSPIGYQPEEEYQQLLSEHLSGLEYFENKTCFIAAMILDICYKMGDEKFYSDIANDFRAVEIIPEYYHVNTKEQLYDYKKVVTQTDYDFSLEMKKYFTSYIKYRDDNFKISIQKYEAILFIFLLKDRYFPNIIFDIV